MAADIEGIADFRAHLTDNFEKIHNVEGVNKLFALVDCLYLRSLKLFPDDQEEIFGKFLLVSHKSFLSAAVLVAQAQPDDAAPIIRRSIECAKIALSISLNKESYKTWVSWEKRQKIWETVNFGKLKKFDFKVNLTPDHPKIKKAKGHIEFFEKMSWILSQQFVHLNPEYMVLLDYKKDGEEPHSELRLNYTIRDTAIIDRYVGLVALVHIKINQVFDVMFNGSFAGDNDWEETCKSTLALAKQYWDCITGR